MNFQNISAKLHDKRLLRVEQWALQPDETWVITGTNGSGKTALSLLLGHKIKLSSGQVDNIPNRVAYVSLEAQAELIEQERYNDQSDLLNKKDHGTLVSDLLAPLAPIEQWLDKLGMRHLLNQGFRSLSTGESRKVLLLKALQEQPDLLVLDAPFEGLDAASRATLFELLDYLHEHGQRMVLVLNRLDEMPAWSTHIAFMHQAQLLLQGEKKTLLALPELQGLLHFDQPLPEFPEPARQPLSLANGEALIELTNGHIHYGDRTLFEQLNWRIEVGQHWAVQGPNGCGKTSLLQLITGDNPQCYANDLRLFGIQRGSGESIWDIKQHIGLVSSSLQWEYRASTNVLTTIISGLYDSIGLYQASGADDKQLALKWLAIIGLNDKANHSLQHLSYGEQRLVLIARALIKQPPLVILDEPCQGLDTPSRLMVLAFIERLALQKSMTLLYVTHHDNEIPQNIHARLVFTPQGDGRSQVAVHENI